MKDLKHWLLPVLLIFLVSCAKQAVQVSGSFGDFEQTGQQTRLAIMPVATELHKPVAITHAGDTSGRLFIILQTGQIVIHDGVNILPVPFLDISGLVLCCGERGLLSVAFHPGYRLNGRFFVNYTNSSGDTVIAEYKVSDDPDRADPGSAVILLEIPQPTKFHNGGQLQFGPDGYLYIGTGDGGSYDWKSEGYTGDNTGLDFQNNAQDKSKLLGKMLRIDIDSSHPYAVPLTNPFADISGARGEIWSMGLRNPWRFSFDRLTGDLFIADVGRSSNEEVNLQPSSSSGAENYGWPYMEGSLCHAPPEQCEGKLLVKPILEYDHGSGCAIIGGYRYRGRMVPMLDGVYIYGDFCSGTIWGAYENGNGKWISKQLFDSRLAISAFGEDENGEIYIADYGGYLSQYKGAVYRLVPDDSKDLNTQQ